MYKRFHGVDLHKRYATVSIRNGDGKEVHRIAKCIDFKDYVSKLNSNDIVIIETVSNAFYWSDEIEKQARLA